MTFTPSPIVLEQSFIPWWPLAISFLLVLVAMAGTIYTIFSRSQYQSSPDIPLMKVLMEDIASGRQPQPGGFLDHDFQSLATRAIELFGRKSNSSHGIADSAAASSSGRSAKPSSARPIDSGIEIEEQPPEESDTADTITEIQSIRAQAQPQQSDSSFELPEASESTEDDPFLQELDDSAFEQIEALSPESKHESQPSASDELPAVTTQAPNISKSIFRAYDIRGIASETLTPEAVRLIGLAIASEARSRGENTIIVANDGRLSSPSIKESLIDGLLHAGCNVVTIGTVPTPVLYFATHELEHSSGIMITGSHNPADYNGFKIILNGETLFGAEIQELYRRISVQDFTSGTGQLSSCEVLSPYQKRILDDVILSRPLKVVLDCGNGVAGKIAPQLFEQLGCDVVPLYCDVDGNFPNHHPDPGQPENLQDLIRKVEETHADLGLAFDGDGDRVGLVTNKGTIIYPDRLLMLLAKDVVSRNPGTDIIFDVKCTRRLTALVSGYGGRPVMWKSGYALIKQKMKETGALLAGEMSGHIFFNERWYGFDDGLYSAARIIEVLAGETLDTETVFSAFPSAVTTPEITIPVDDERKFQLVERLADTDFPGGNTNTIDGIRVDYPWGWGLVRASNTGPTLTCRFEADDDAGLDKIQSLFREHLVRIEPDLPLPF